MVTSLLTILATGWDFQWQYLTNNMLLPLEFISYSLLTFVVSSLFLYVF